MFMILILLCIMFYFWFGFSNPWRCLRTTQCTSTMYTTFASTYNMTVVWSKVIMSLPTIWRRWCQRRRTFHRVLKTAAFPTVRAASCFVFFVCPKHRFMVLIELTNCCVTQRASVFYDAVYTPGILQEYRNYSFLPTSNFYDHSFLMQLV